MRHSILLVSLLAITSLGSVAGCGKTDDELPLSTGAPTEVEAAPAPRAPSNSKAPVRPAVVVEAQARPAVVVQAPDRPRVVVEVPAPPSVTITAPAPPSIHIHN